MARDLSTLTAPLSEMFGQGAGPDLSYSDERTALEAPFQLDANGDPVEDRAWRDSIKLIDEQSAQTRDLWLGAYLARAGAKIGDLQTVVDGTGMLAGLLDNLWSEVHPSLEEADFIGRRTPCDSLTKIREFLAPLRRAVIFEHRMGKVTGEDLERFATEGAAADGYAQFRSALDSADADRAEEIRQAFEDAVAKLDAIRASLGRVDAVLVANAGSETGTNFQPTYDLLAAMRAAALPYIGATEEPAPEGDGFSMTANDAGPATAGRVNSREDVVRSLDAVIAYYAAREPGSPVPVLLKRARHWVAMDFLEVLDDLVPESMDGARRVLVSKLDQPKSGDGFSSY